MPDLKLGTKYDCYNCSTKFYDLGKSDPICPKCGADQRDSMASEAPSTSQSSRRKRKTETPRPVEVEDEETATVEVPEDEEIAPEDLEGADLGGDDEEEEEDFDDED
ncbi:MAG TPA: TIGR02300 family protein [Thermoanaerobaculia bacterium]|jgi:uncharacterized protein (TIGR02300 family)|nr:TIGR02300 family protein [Thermoanaerobaculia bacterium]